jgi:hypothetical protein
MEDNRQVGLKQRTPPIRGEYGDFVASRYGADEKVGIRSLDPLATTEIEEFSRRLVITDGQFHIGKGPQVVAQLPELGLAPDPAKEFLPYRADHLDPHLSDQLNQFSQYRAVGGSIAPQGKGPDGCVDQHPHRFLRSAL